MGGYTSIKP